MPCDHQHYHNHRHRHYHHQTLAAAAPAPPPSAASPGCTPYQNQVLGDNDQDCTMLGTNPPPDGFPLSLVAALPTQPSTPSSIDVYILSNKITLSRKSTTPSDVVYSASLPTACGVTGPSTVTVSFAPSCCPPLPAKPTDLLFAKATLTTANYSYSTDNGTLVGCPDRAYAADPGKSTVTAIMGNSKWKNARSPPVTKAPAYPLRATIKRTDRTGCIKNWHPKCSSDSDCCGNCVCRLAQGYRDKLCMTEYSNTKYGCDDYLLHYNPPTSPVSSPVWAEISAGQTGHQITAFTRTPISSSGQYTVSWQWKDANSTFICDDNTTVYSQSDFLLEQPPLDQTLTFTDAYGGTSVVVVLASWVD